MTVGYYRLPSWAYCENGLEHQNAAPFNKCYSSLSFVRQRSRKAPRLQADEELATLLGPPQRLAEACKIDISYKRRVIYNSIDRFYNNVGNRVITIGILTNFVCAQF